MTSDGTLEVVGLSGTGKSTVAKAIAKDLECSFMDFADLLVDDGDGNHDVITTWAPAKLGDKVVQAQERIAEAASTQRVVLETHICPNVPGEGYRPTSPSVMERRKTRGIIFVWSNHANLHEMRKRRGAQRDTTILSLEQFTMDHNATLASCIALASLTSIACFPCENRPDHLSSVLAAVLPVARRMMGI